MTTGNKTCGWVSTDSMVGDRVNLFTNTVCLNIRLGMQLRAYHIFFSEKNMHQKIIYTPQFYCLKNLCSFHLSPPRFFECSPSRTRSLLLLLRSMHSASGRTIRAHADTKQCATGSQELVCKGSGGWDRARTSKRGTKAVAGKCVVPSRKYALLAGKG